MITKNSIWMFVILLAFSCSNPGEDRDTITRIPEYFSEFTIGDVLYNQKIALTSHRMGTYKSYALLLEPYKGVHLTSDFSDKQSVIFWDLPGITEFTITEDRLTFQMMRDVFTIDISDENEPKLISKVISNQVDVNSLSPYKLNGSFECVDPSKGYIKNWIEENIFDPKCWK